MSTDPLLRLTGVSKSYWHGSLQAVAVADVSLELQAGELVAIWGQRGSGKTTLARLAAGLQAPDEGAVAFNGEAMAVARSSSTPLLRDGIGWVAACRPSSEDLRSVVDYVALPLLGKHSPRSARRRAERSAETSRCGRVRGRALGELDRRRAHARRSGARTRARAEAA